MRILFLAKLVLFLCVAFTHAQNCPWGTTTFSSFEGRTDGTLFASTAQCVSFNGFGEISESGKLLTDWGSVEYSVSTKQTFLDSLIQADVDNYTFTVHHTNPSGQTTGVSLSLFSQTKALQAGRSYVREVEANFSGAIPPGVSGLFTFATFFGNDDCFGAPQDSLSQPFENTGTNPMDYSFSYERNNWILICSEPRLHCIQYGCQVGLTFPPNFKGTTSISVSGCGIGQNESNSIVVGDLNQDGLVNLLDVQGFVDALSIGAFNPLADINGDGVVDLLDVQSFIDLLAG